MDNQNPTQVPPVNPAAPVGVPPVVEIVPPQAEPQQTPPSSKFSLSPKIMLIILAILIIAVVGSGIYLSQSYQPKPTPTPTPTIASKPTPTPAGQSPLGGADPTADWKTYTSLKGKYSIKYPADYKEFNNQNDTGFSIMHSDTQFVMENFTLGIRVVTNSKGLALENALGNGPLMKYGPEFLEPNKTKEITIDKTDAIRADNLNVGQAGNLTDIIFIKDDLLYQITASPLMTTNLAQFDQILSTFKFTDSSQALSQKDIEEIKIAVAQKDGQPLSNEHITFDTTNDKYNGSYATGQVGPLNGGGGAKWFASKIENQWIVVWVGNGLPTCAEIAKYNLPEDFISCY